jgi:hypothetical protein
LQADASSSGGSDDDDDDDDDDGGGSDDDSDAVSVPGSLLSLPDWEAVAGAERSDDDEPEEQGQVGVWG